MILISFIYHPIFAFAEPDYEEQQEYVDQAIYDNDSANEGSDYDYDQYDVPPQDDQAAASPFDDAAVTDENGDVIINILTNDIVYFGDQRTPRIDQVSEPSIGKVIANADGTIIYSPLQQRMPRNSSAIDTFFYTASFVDDTSSYYSGKITITINQINDAPRVIDSEYVITENQEFSFYLKAYDEDNDKLVFYVTSDPTTRGDYVLDEHIGMITYTPYTDFTGQDFVTYVVWDGTSRSDPATVMIDVVEQGGNVVDFSEEDNDAGSEESISYDYYYYYYYSQYNDYSSAQVEELTENDNEEYSPAQYQDPIYPWNLTSDVNDNVTNTNTNTNTKPIADAGIDLGVYPREQVSLDGFGSYDPDGDIISYSWSQIFGPTVTLVNPKSANPTFVSPAVASDTTIIFELVTSDSLSNSTASFVTITVEAKPEVQIDILPNLYPNNINTNKGDEKVPVAIFGSISLDVAKYIDKSSLRFGPHSAKVISWELKDMDTDAFDDLILYFTIADLGLQSGHTKSCLSGSMLVNGDPFQFESCDSVKVLNQNL